MLNDLHKTTVFVCGTVLPTLLVFLFGIATKATRMCVIGLCVQDAIEGFGLKWLLNMCISSD